LVLALLGLSLFDGRASAAESSEFNGRSPSDNPLVVPGVNELLKGQPAVEAEEARLANPETVTAREESQTKYAGLSAGAAEKVDGEAFPGIISEPAGGPLTLPAGDSIVGFPSDSEAQVDMPEGKRGVLESMGPIAAEVAPGRRVAMNLSLAESNGAFEPQASAVKVRISKELKSGVSFGETGVSLTPVTEAGGSVGGVEGSVDGSVVFYSGVSVGNDVDEVVKPEPDGFSEDAILRSAASPERLVYRVGMPAGATLQANDKSGAVDVLDDGSAIAAVLPPVAYDAAGVAVPVSMSVEGNSLLVLNLDKSTGDYEFPIMVDPSAEDTFFGKTSGHNTNWHFVNSGSDFTGTNGSEAWYIFVKAHHGEHEWGAVEYTAPGEARIVELKESGGEAKGMPAAQHVENYMEIFSSKGENEGGKVALPTEGHFPNHTITTKGSSGNTAAFFSSATHVGEISEEGRLQIGSASGSEVSVLLEQEKGPEVSVDTTHEYVDSGKKNVFYGSNGWIGPNSGAFEFHAKDPGVGMREYVVSAEKEEKGWQDKDFLFETECSGVVCPKEINKGLSYNSEMPNGEDTLKVRVTGFDGSAETTETLKVDSEPPHNLTFSGLPGDHEVADGQPISLKATVEDGGEGKPSPGIASIVLEVDGEAVGGPQGACSGACTGKANWTLDSENYPAGEHTLTVIATDNAGNVDKEEYHLTIHHPEGVQVGPGSVNPVTGELSMAATDVSVGVPGGDLTVGRSYRSRHLEQGTEGPLGPQWSLALGGEQSLYRVSGGMVLTGGGGEEITFESKGGSEFSSPTGDAGLTLLEKTKEGKTIFTLSENGSVTTFELPSGSSGGVWMPSSTEGPNGTNTTLYKFRLKGGVIEPTEDLAPIPAGVSCGAAISELKEGCRALEFEYDEGETTAKGEKQSEWGEFAGHLSKIKYIAWTGSKTKEEPVVAKYEYDKKGRLRAEWNPEVKPNAVKTIYGYDNEGHVTAISTTGHEPSLLEQGTIPSDAGPGRLLAVAVPSAGTALGGGEAPVSAEAPTLSSTTPKVGVKISVNLTSEKTPGKWSAGPLAFIYQWEDCNSSGKECSPIVGAVNQGYYPVAGDEGHELVAEVTALNAMGATTVTSATTSTVASGTPNTPLPEPPEVGSDAVTTLEYRVPASGSGAPHELSSAKAAEWGQSDDPSEAEAMAVFPPDKPMGWPAKEYKRETVYYLDGKDRLVNVASPTGGISTTEYNRYNDVTRTLSPDNRTAALKESCVSEKECKSAELAGLLSTESTYEEGGAEPGTELLSTLGPQHTVKLAVGKGGKENEEALAREHTTYSYNEGEPSKGGPYHLVTKTVAAAQTASKEEFDQRTTKTSYAGQEGLGWSLRKPTSVTTDPGGLNLVHTTEYSSATGEVIETKMPAAAGHVNEYALPSGSRPFGITVGPDENLWYTDVGTGKVGKITTGGAATEYAAENDEPEGITTGPDKNLWFVEHAIRHVNHMTTSGSLTVYTLTRTGTYNVGIVTGPDENLWFTESEDGYVGKINTKDEVLGEYALPSGSKPYGITVGADKNLWFTDYGTGYIGKITTAGAVTEYKLPSGSDPYSIVAGSDGNLWFTDYGTGYIGKITTSGAITEYKLPSGSEPRGIAAGPEGNLWFAEYGTSKIGEITTSGTITEYELPSGSEPVSVVAGPDKHMWFTEYGTSKIGKIALNSAAGNEGAHDTKTIYYSTSANSEYKECGEHPAFANLPCETTPAVQPGTVGLPELPVKTVTYNIWGQPETITEAVGATKRTTTNSYDEAGRLKTTAISSTVGEPFPTVTNEYNAETGVLEKQCTNEGKPCTEGKPKTITNTYNRLGQLTSYTDAAESSTSYEYDIDGRTKKISDSKGTEAKGSETYTYSETTGLPAEEIYENGTTKLAFTATYDVEGNMLTEGYPNNMTASYTYNQIGKPTNLEYKKNTHCATSCPEVWFSDSVIPSIHGQWLEQTSSLSHQTYAYDQAGRLTEVQNTTGGKCTARLYGYDEDTNRTSLTTRESGTEKCAAEGGTVQEHTYDTADRLTDPGIAYNTFGDITTLPAKDAEPSGEHELTSSYYTDGQVASQKQNKQTIGYNLDPAGRALEIISTGEPTNSTIINHYAGPGNGPAWTENAISHEWSRDIAGLNGTLTAIQNNGETPVLQLTNLQGDLIAKASASETTTALLAKADTSEYGVPTIAAPAKYSWLGAIELPTELPSGVTSMGARSYVPQIGRFLQPDPIPGGSANAYAYTFGDPVNTTDPTGDYVECSYCTAYFDHRNNELVEQEDARIAAREAAERAAREAAERAAAEAAAEAAVAGPQYEGEEWEEWWEEEGEYEYVSYHHGVAGREEAAHAEGGVLYQPLGSQGAGEGTTLLGSVIPLCAASSEGPCADFEVMTNHFSGRQFRVTCRVVAALAVGCGGDDFMQRFNESQARPPEETPVTEYYDPPQPRFLEGIDDDAMPDV
jgi:RHS repeat-associated protein